MFARFLGALRFLLQVWSGELGGDDEVAMRVSAFVAMRALAVQLPRPFIDLALKGAYVTFMKRAKFVNNHT
jgi:hypothetical protein